MEEEETKGEEEEWEECEELADKKGKKGKILMEEWEEYLVKGHKGNGRDQERVPAPEEPG